MLRKFNVLNGDGIHYMIRFKVVVPSFNSVQWIGRTLASIEQQTYPHVEVCIVDDASTLQGQREIIETFCQKNRWHKIFKTVNQGSLHSIVVGIQMLNCQDDDVIVIVDGDDWLYDSHALEKVAKVYEEESIFLTYGNYITHPPSFSGNPMRPDKEIIDKKLYRRQPFVFSHLRTYKGVLWRHLKDEDLRDDQGEYFRVAGDLVTMWPLIEMAGHRFRSIEDILYVYNVSNPLNDFKLVPDEVMEVRRLMERRPVYDTLPCCRD